MARNSFARHLRQAREAAGLSQFALARLAGISQQQISAVETGDRDVSWDEAVTLIEACGGKITVHGQARATSATSHESGLPVNRRESLRIPIWRHRQE